MWSFYCLKPVFPEGSVAEAGRTGWNRENLGEKSAKKTQKWQIGLMLKRQEAYDSPN